MRRAFFTLLATTAVASSTPSQPELQRLQETVTQIHPYDHNIVRPVGTHTLTPASLAMAWSCPPLTLGLKGASSIQSECLSYLGVQTGSGKSLGCILGVFEMGTSAEAFGSEWCSPKFKYWKLNPSAVLLEDGPFRDVCIINGFHYKMTW